MNLKLFVCLLYIETVIFTKIIVSEYYEENSDYFFCSL